MAEITNRLENVWRDLWQVFGESESWDSDPVKCKEIQQRLSRFNRSHSDDSEHINNVIQALSKGYNLLKSGIEWHEPVIGHQSIDKLNNTHKARGVQWKLVMVWGGFETITKIILPKPNKKNNFKVIIQNFIDELELPMYVELTAPDSTRANLEKWLAKPNCGKSTALSYFLSLQNTDQEIIDHWIIQSQPISTWGEAVRLAKAMRNATAHGALSASKVKQWGMQKSLLTLSDNLGEIVVAGLQKLI
ncbi:MAG: hypothetical protein VKL59_11590 [Nostocaceae cyanobacterium]|nr:hypothetical protein [Nostocaceae cyanobacterium]